MLPEFSALENVCIPGWLAGRKKKEVEAKARELLEILGLNERLENKPNQLSGGEQQRVAVARALINDPSVVFADEPTGNLDPETSEGIMRLLIDIAKSGRVVVMATHNYSLMEKFPARVIKCEGGKLSEL